MLSLEQLETRCVPALIIEGPLPRNHPPVVFLRWQPPAVPAHTFIALSPGESIVGIGRIFTNTTHYWVDVVFSNYSRMTRL